MYKIRYQVVPLILTIALSVCSPVLSTAKHQDTKTPDFIFSSKEDDEFTLKLMNMNTGEGEQLESQITYTDKIVKLIGLEPISIEDLQSGKVGLDFYYSVIQSNTEEKQSDFFERNVNNENNEYKESITKLGEVLFHLSEDEPYWRISNENGSWGIGIRDIGIPEVIYELLPDKVYGMEGIHDSSLQATNDTLNNSIYKNNIRLTQNTPMIEDKTILLSDLHLPNNIMKQITANKVQESCLEIMTNYTFKVKVPLDGISTNISNYQIKPLWIEGKITIRYTVDVKHNIL